MKKPEKNSAEIATYKMKMEATPKHRVQTPRRSKMAKPSIWISSLAICALAVSTFTATTASSEPTYSCPTGFENKDFFEPQYCDKLIIQDTSFTVPEGVTQISVMAIGGGGAGGGGGSTAGVPKAGGGGGAGEITQASLTVVRDEVLTITVGAGGSGGTVNEGTGVAADGGDGSTTTVRDSANTVRVSAVGGKGGKSGTNGGDGGASGNSTPADINPGGTGFNSNGRSSGGGGGGFNAAGVNGASLDGGDGGQGPDLTGEFGFPVFQNNQMAFFTPALKLLYNEGLGHGGGGGVVARIIDNVAEEAVLGHTHGVDGNEGHGAGTIYGEYNGEEYGAFDGVPQTSSWAITTNYTESYPGQGGSGGAGLPAGAAEGTRGVPGVVWLRVHAIQGDDGGGGGGGGGGFTGTYFNLNAETLPYGESIGVSHDATGNLWMAFWVNEMYVGPSISEVPASYDWDSFSFFASCEDQEITLALYGDDVDPGLEFVPEFPEPSLEDAIGQDSFTYGGDPELCGSGGGGGGGGGNYTPVVETKLNPCQAVSGVENVTRKAKSFSGFAINSAVLTKAMKKEIRSFLRKHPKEVCVSVAGFTMGPRVLSTDSKLAKDRARVVRAYIKSLRPDAAFTKIKWSTEKRVGDNVRRAKVTLRF